MDVTDGPLNSYSHHHHHHRLSSQQVSKRVCRNLTAEFCSDFSETSENTAPSEPNLDLWVLRTLGLKDRDTIDTSNDSSSSSGFSLGGLVYDAAVTSSSSSEYSSTPPSVPSCCPSYSTSECQEADPRSCADPALTCTSPPDQRSDFTPCGGCNAPAALISSYSPVTAFNSPLTGETPDICSPGPQRPEASPADPSAYWSPLKTNRTPPQDTIQFSPPAEGVFYSPISSSSPVVNQTWSCNPVSPAAGSQAPATPQTPRNRTELAFSMSLSPSNSVKTHSFPQGQAFVRKDTEGRWNFTWVPRQGP